MQLSNKSIEEFQKIYSEDYGVMLNFEEAKEHANLFFNAMQVIYKPILKDK